MKTKTAEAKQSEKAAEVKPSPLQPTNEILKPIVRKPDIIDIIRRIHMAPDSLTRDDFMILQRTIGNQALIKLLGEIQSFRNRQKGNKEEQTKGEADGKTQNPKKNETGMPDSLKAGIEKNSGVDMSDVRVHKNSDKPGQMGALAYTFGSDIYLGPGQERYLAHEGWHAVQQKLRKVKPQVQMKSGANLNNDSALEREADIMGDRSAKAGKSAMSTGNSQSTALIQAKPDTLVIQRAASKKEANNQKQESNNIKEPKLSEIELKGMTTFKPPKALADYLDKNPNGMNVKVRYGKFANGSVKISKSGDRYIMLQQAISLTNNIFSDYSLLGLSPCLIVSIDSKGMIAGYFALKDGDKIPPSEQLKDQIVNDPSFMGLRGMNLDKSVKLDNSIDNGFLKIGIKNAPVYVGKVFSGTVSLAIEPDSRKISFSGSASVNINGLASGTITLGRSPKGNITGSVGLAVKLTPHFSGSVAAKLDGDNFTGEGKVRYLGEKLTGMVTLKLQDKNNISKSGQENKTSSKKDGQKPNYVVTGEGDLAFAFTDWLSGTAHAEVDEKGNVTIVGQIVPQKEVELFKQKDFNKQLAKLEARAIYGVPLLGNVFVFANIGLEAFAKLGPAKLYKIAVGGTYSTDPEKSKDFTIQASLNISAAAGVNLRAEGGAGVQLLGHDVKAGVGVNAMAVIEAYAEATPKIGYKENAKKGQDKKGEFFIAGELEIAAQPFFGLGGDLFVEVDSPWWSPVGDHKWKWPFVNKTYPLGSSFGVKANVQHVLGSKQAPEIEFGRVEFSSDKFLTDLMSNKTSGKKSSDKKKGKWNEKNSKDAQPPKKQKGGKDTGGRSSTNSSTQPKSSRYTSANSKTKKDVDPNLKMADGKTVRQHQDEAVNRGKKPDKQYIERQNKENKKKQDTGKQNGKQTDNANSKKKTDVKPKGKNNDKNNTGVSKAQPKTWNEFQAANKGKYDKKGMSNAWAEYKKEHGIKTADENKKNNGGSKADEGGSGTVSRPSWRQSEKDVANDYPGYKEQQSFKDGDPASYGKKGSSRPDLYTDGHSIEVKNYNVTTSSGRSNLVSNISNQISKRVNDLPAGTKQTIVIDVRGQSVSRDVLREIKNEINIKTNGVAEIIFKQ